jgi:hypothetical protein
LGCSGRATVADGFIGISVVAAEDI